MSWEVVVNNPTNKPVSFILFQENGIMDENSYSTVWYKDTVEPSGKAGPFLVPAEVKISIEAPSTSIPLQEDIVMLGPVEVKKGDTWEFDIDGNTLENVQYEKDEEVVNVQSKSSNADQLTNVSVWKAGRRVFTQKNLKGGDQLEISITNKVFIALVATDKYHPGEQFQILSLQEIPIAFEITNKPVVEITATIGDNGAVTFK